jgi:hypothetical protein
MSHSSCIAARYRPMTAYIRSDKQCIIMPCTWLLDCGQPIPMHSEGYPAPLPHEEPAGHVVHEARIAPLPIPGVSQCSSPTFTSWHRVAQRISPSFCSWSITFPTSWFSSRCHKTAIKILRSTLKFSNSTYDKIEKHLHWTAIIT